MHIMDYDVNGETVYESDFGEHIERLLWRKRLEAHV